MCVEEEEGAVRGGEILERTGQTEANDKIPNLQKRRERRKRGWGKKE